MHIDWKGVMPAVTTKFTREDTLDLTMFEVNIKAQMNAGVHGIILGGTLGEASTLSTKEKEILSRETLRIVNRTIPVIMNIAEQTTQGAIKAAVNAKKNGVNGLMLLPPMRYKADRRETITYFKKVANATDLPVMIYNNPIDYGIEVTIDMLEELVTSCPNIKAVKESTRDISNITRLKSKFGKKLSILSGVDTLALESLVLGADGWVAGLVCAFPQETVAIYNLIKKGNIEKALEIYRWFLPLLELDISTKLVQNIKLAEVATGIGTPYVREPRLQLIGEERAQVLQIIEKGIKSRPCLDSLAVILEL
ncbi:dihydrodipicolinate synthase family protein [Tenacibaculum sp. SG-28]|uniref:dihydrodipicolinate synthase family protein n=1 Tax=Tenacibaculum sp. SG-28 TaxID=754426 RepID=UPI000CF3E633|nr:dihydrodipicolinate synthase family protein [Tenacibaculum sp. SG-28]PQJ22790.1 dihydrodipicolinate synthase family protein [Tenacibaculum sp. SG-28]